MIATESPDGANPAQDGPMMRIVARQLGTFDVGRGLLERLREHPADQARRDMASSALAQFAAADPELRDTLRRAVLGTPTSVALTSTGDHNISVTGGAFDNSTHNTKRTTKIPTGGWIVAGLLALTIGTTTVVAASSETDPGEIGTERTEEGVREAATGYWEAFVAKDAERTCAFINESKRIGTVAESCVEYLNNRVFTTISAERFEELRELTVGEVEINRNPNTADTKLMRGDEAVKSLNLDYEGGRWFVYVEVTMLGGD
ncbi:hypothetical protein JNUCC0626_09350 [Lentzea sp. JNUCC 0626]|uniref:hypothetical protein n=1 Tax=Lentzea sp. JNUCC 0626 TaxID=3367513 RepID=UPI00374A80B9